MKTNRLFSIVMTISLGAILFSACSSEPTPIPLTSADMPIPGREISHADAALAGKMFVPWPMQDDSFTEGPYRRYTIETNEEGALTGFTIYSLGLPNVDSSSLKSTYETELGRSGWEIDDDFGGDAYVGFSWTRGNQAYIVVVHEASGYLYTFLLNK